MWSNVSCKACVSLLIFCLDDLSIDVSEIVYCNFRAIECGRSVRLLLTDGREIMRGPRYLGRLPRGSPLGASGGL